MFRDRRRSVCCTGARRRRGVDNGLHGRVRVSQQGGRRILPKPYRTNKEPGPNKELGLSGERYLGTRATHIDGELEGIALALEAHNEKNTGMLAILSDCRPAIRVTEKLDSGTEGPRSSIEARIQRALEIRENKQQETYLMWAQGHKDIKGNEAADTLSKRASILGHESEGVVTPAGLKASRARRVRAEARGGNGNGLLGWCRKALSVYTWCRTNKGPQSGCSKSGNLRHNDRDTRRGRVSGTGPVQAA